MSRIDKYEPNVGGFRAPIGFNTTAAQMGVAFGVGLDVNGRVQLGGANTGIKGVMVNTSAKSVGDIVDIMTFGELVEFPGVPGTNYFSVLADGTITTAADTGGTTPIPNTFVGHTVEATRLVVRRTTR